jgi:ABC-type iron transport system FetAB ATPase subunit
MLILDLYEKYSALDEDEKNMIDMMLKKFKKSE